MKVARQFFHFTIWVFIFLFDSVAVQAQDNGTTIPLMNQTLLKKDTNITRATFTNGYSIQDRKYTSSSVSFIDLPEFNSIPAGNIANQLQGLLSGLTITGNGQPGSTSKLRVRGLGSFENNEPLYMVDGVPTQDIRLINPADVESLSVLKDAGTASIYGSRAANGVIIITTKKGRKNLRVNFNMLTGVQDPGKGTSEDLLSSTEYANLQWLVYKNDGTIETNPIYGPSTNSSPQMPFWASNTNWYNVITRKAGIKNYDLSLSSGGENSNFFASIGYFDQQGIILSTFSKKISTRFNSDFTFLNGHIKIGENLSGVYLRGLSVSNLDEENPILNGPYRSQSIIPAIISTPINGLSHNFVPGEFGGTGIAPRLGNNSNVYADLVRAGDDSNNEFRFLGNVYMDIFIIKGLYFQSSYGGTWGNGYSVSWKGATYENSENASLSSLTEAAFYNVDHVWTNTLIFSRDYGKHRVNAIMGIESLNYGAGRNLIAQRQGYFSNSVDFRTLNNGSVISVASSQSYNATDLSSEFMKADYAFMDKYLIGASIRRDGCSRYSESNRFAVYPSLSAGWRIGHEPFMEKISWLGELIIRGSYGSLGNVFASSPQNLYNLPGNGNSPATSISSDAKVETTNITNLGFESAMFGDKISFRMDVYSKKSSNILLSLPILGPNGISYSPLMNAAAIHNTGIDVEFSFSNRWGDFGLSTSAIFTSYKNEINRFSKGMTFIDYGNSRLGSFTRSVTGNAISSFYGYKVIGLFKDAQEVASAPFQDGAEPGFFRFANLDNTNTDGTGRQMILSKDRTILGNPNPKFTYGFNLVLNYKHFDLMGFFYGSQGNDIYNLTKWWTDFWPSFQGQKSRDLLYNSWTPLNTGASTPRASGKSNFSTNTQSSSYYIEDGSFLRLKSLQVGYTIPPKISEKLKIRSLRLYAQALNLFTITRYSGLDPELGGSDLNFGVDYGNYPIVQEYVFGINLALE